MSTVLLKICLISDCVVGFECHVFLYFNFIYCIVVSNDPIRLLFVNVMYLDVNHECNDLIG